MTLRFLLASLAIAAGVSSIRAQVAPKPPVRLVKPPVAAPPVKPAEPRTEFQISRSIKVGGEGRWEGVTLDAAGKNLYIARNGRMQVVDLVENKVRGEIAVRGARSVTLVPALNRGFVTSGQESQVVVFDIPTLDVLGSIKIDGNPGASAYDPATKKVLVCCTEGKCVTPIPADIDLKTGKADKAIEVTGRPTSIVTDSNGAAFVSIMERDEIALIDTKAATVLTRWPCGIVTRPAGLSIDEPSLRIFVALRNVSLRNRLGVFSMADGHEIASVDMRVPQTESTAYCKGNIFVTTTDGQLIVVGQARDTGRYEIQQTLKIGEGSSSMATDPKTGNVYVPTVSLEGRRPVRDSFKVDVISKKP